MSGRFVPPAPVGVRAVLIGVERYDDPGWNIPGAAQARRFATWLLDRGVPPERIHLFLSEEQPPENDPLGHLNPREPTQANCQDFFLKELPTLSAELLILYWAGHGIVTGDEKRCLFYSDAGHAVPRCHDLDSLRRYLWGEHFDERAFGDQLVLVDACATYPEDLDWESRLVPQGWPRARKKLRQQFTVFAAPQGNAALAAAGRGAAIFSDELLGLLEDAPPEPWLPDPRGLLRDLNLRIEEQRKRRPALSYPAYIDVWDWEERQETLRFGGRRERAETPSGLRPIPRAPAHYLPREETLQPLREALLQDAPGKVGLLGVRGMGGVGKTVLAAALCRETAIQAHFEEIFWFVLGQQPRLQVLQEQLAKAVGAEWPGYSTVGEGARALGKIFQGRRVLVVLDDVWRAGDAKALDVLGDEGRLLLTTRDRGVLAGVGAAEHQVDQLSESQAREFLASWAGKEESELPAAADEVAKECGYLPLALALIGAMVQHRPTGWEDALRLLQSKDLERIKKRHGDYAFPDLFAALHVSVEALPKEERQRYLELAVFPEDAAIPPCSLENLWRPAGLDDLDTKDLIEALIARSLLFRNANESLSLHDLQADYLSREAGDDLPSLHDRLVEGYAARCEGDFPAGPNDGYFFQHLPWHLAQAGRHEALAEILFDARWLEKKLAITGPQPLIADCALLDDPEAARLGRILRQASHILGPSPEELAPQLLGRVPDDPERPRLESLLAGAQSRLHPRQLRPTSPSLVPRSDAVQKILQGHTDGVKAVAVLPSGHLASADSDGTIRVWDLDADEPTRTLRGHTGGIYALAVLPSGHLVSADSDGTIRVWDLDAGQPTHTLHGHTGWINALAVLAAGHLASAGDDGTIRVWDLDAGQPSHTLDVHDSGIYALVVLPSGHLASADSDGAIRIWDLHAGQPSQTLHGHTGGINALAVLPSGHLASAGNDRTIRVWDLHADQPTHTLQGHTSGINALAVLPVGHLASAGDDGTVRVWDLHRDQPTHTLHGHTSGINALAVLASGRLASTGQDRTIRVWDLHADQPTRTLHGHTGWIRALAVLPSGHLASAGDDRTIRVWDLGTDEPTHTLQGHTGGIFALAVLPSGHLASAGDDRTIRVWELDADQPIHTLQGLIGWITALAVLPAGHLASGGQDGTIRVWNLHTDQPSHTLQGHTGWIRTLAVLPSGHLASGGQCGTIRVWNLHADQPSHTLQGHTGWIRTLAVLPSGHLASAGDDRTIRVWDLGADEPTHTLQGHTDWIHALAVLPSGRLASAGDDRTIRVWDLETWQQLSKLSLDAPATGILWEPKTQRLICGDAAGALHRLEIRGEDKKSS